MEPIYHSSGSFTLDLRRALEHAASRNLHTPSEAIASLVAALALWQPQRIEIERKSRLKLIARQVGCTVDPLRLLTDLVLGKAVEPVWLLRHFASGLRSLLATPNLSLGLWNGANLQVLCGQLRERGARQDVEIIVAGLPSLDVACLQRRLRFSAWPIEVDGKPLPLHGSQAGAVDFLWESFQLTDSASGQNFAGWSVGPAALDLGVSDLNQPRTQQRGRVRILGRYFAPGPRQIVSEHKNLHLQSIFRNTLSSRMFAPACRWAATLELRPRAASQWRAVVDGWSLDAVDFPQAPPGWRVWLAAPASAADAALRGYRDPTPLRQQAEQALHWSRQRLSEFEERLREQRKALRV